MSAAANKRRRAAHVIGSVVMAAGALSNLILTLAFDRADIGPMTAVAGAAALFCAWGSGRCWRGRMTAADLGLEE